MSVVRNKTYQRRSMYLVFVLICLVLILLFIRLGYLMIAKADYYGSRAKTLHERERTVKARRGRILDRNGTVIAGNKSVSTISVIHSQITEPDKVVEILSKELGLSEEKVRKRVEKVSSIERIKSNVSKEVSDSIRAYDLDGVMVDEDYKRYYYYDEMASKVIGFTGADNQGIIGLEVAYEDTLKGIDGAILTLTRADGVEINNAAEDRREPIAGNDLVISLDMNIQRYATQAANKVLEAKSAKSVRILMMNPGNGEIYAMVNTPEFNLNDPYTLVGVKDADSLSDKKKNKELNAMWRNACISDTYEPGSTFKVITAAAALEEGVVKETDTFSCPGFKVVEDRRIRCHKVKGHGAETFVQGIQNSCNPVFIEVGARLGVSGMFRYLKQFGILEKAGIDVPGEAATIMHRQSDVGAVELATMSFGQSFQLTPVRLLSTVSTIINGGHSIVPHFGVQVQGSDGSFAKTLSYESEENIVSDETSATMRKLLESVVTEGGGSKAAVEGYLVGAKTGTSEKLPRSSKKYIASCIGFAPADNPQVIAIVMIDEPQGLYYGGTIAAPVIAELLDNVLPYLTAG